MIEERARPGGCCKAARIDAFRVVNKRFCVCMPRASGQGYCHIHENLCKHSLMAAIHEATHSTETSAAQRGEPEGLPLLAGVERVLLGRRDLVAMHVQPVPHHR
jgi:hypothetical protein